MSDQTEPVLTDAETLRAAAAKLREYAGRASKTWNVDVVGPLGADTVLRGRTAVTNLWPDASWIDLASPEIAEPLAAWLETEADDLDGSLCRLQGAQDAELVAVDVAAGYRPAVRLARTILTGVDRGE